MPSKKFLIANLLVATMGIIAFLIAIERLDQDAAPATTPAREEVFALPPSPPLVGFTPDPTRCPDLAPRTTPLNGPGWRIITDRTLCLVAEYPDGWEVRSTPTGISFVEPTEENRGETAFPGELSAEVHVRFFAGPKNQASEHATISEEATPMHAHVAAYRIRMPDGTLVTANGHAPENDTAKEAVVRSILRSIDLHGRTETLFMSTYVP